MSVIFIVHSKSVSANKDYWSGWGDETKLKDGKIKLKETRLYMYAYIINHW